MPVTLSYADKKLALGTSVPTTGCAPKRPRHQRRPADPDLLNRTETSEYLRVSVSSLAHWASAGKGPPVHRIGRASYYHLDDLRAWMRPDTLNGAKP